MPDQYYESNGAGNPPNQTSIMFYSSILQEEAGETWLIQFTVDQTAVSFEIVEG